jgi:hypothetical protein
MITFYGDLVAPLLDSDSTWNRYLEQRIQPNQSDFPQQFTVHPQLDSIVFNYINDSIELKSFEQYSSGKNVVIIGLHGGWNELKLPFIKEWFLSNSNRLTAWHDINCQIVLDYSEEGFTTEFFNAAHNWIIENDLQDRVLYISSSINVSELYLSWCKQHKQRPVMKAAWFGFFANWINFNRRFTQDESYTVPMAMWQAGAKRYMSLNRRPYPHRILLTTLLEHLSLIEQGAISMPKYFKEPDINWEELDFDTEYQWEMLTERYNGHIDYLSSSFISLYNKLPLIADTDRFDINHAMDLNSEFYKHYPINVITETLFFTKSIFTSEKIWKPMLHGQIFLPLAAPYYLQSLRELGFKTFAPYINEEYDLIEDPIERAQALVKVLEGLLQLSESDFNKLLLNCKPLVEHNRQLINDKTRLDRIISIRAAHAIETYWE